MRATKAFMFILTNLAHSLHISEVSLWLFVWSRANSKQLFIRSRANTQLQTRQNQLQRW